jgi:hypothetical protein
MTGKLWKAEEEQLLRSLVESGVKDVKLLAKRFKRSEGAIQEKLRRMGLHVVVRITRKNVTTTSTSISKTLLTHEKVLKVLAGAIKKAGKPGLGKIEIMRLKILVDAAKTYDSVLEKFEKWSEIEARLVEMDKKIQELHKAQKFSS